MTDRKFYRVTFVIQAESEENAMCVVEDAVEEAGYIPYGIYAIGVKSEHEIDIGIKNKNGTDEWNKINDVLRQWQNCWEGVTDVSAGTGMGIRDMQFLLDEDQVDKYPQMKEHMKRLAEYWGLELEYMSMYTKPSYGIDAAASA